MQISEMQTIRLSIIIPFFNVEKYIGRCLDSVYRQDIPEDEYEVICVDDCSPDGSLSVVKQFAVQHPNLRIIRNEKNRKLGGARNAGMEVAEGKYVWFIDSDDFIEENVFATMLSVAERDNLDVLHFNYENYPERTPLHIIRSEELMTGQEMFFCDAFIWYHDLVTAWRKLYKRSFLTDNHIAFAEHIMYEDSDYAIWVFSKAKRARHIDLFAYNYSVNPESITRVKYNSSHVYYWLDLCNRMLSLESKLMEEGADLRFQIVINQFIRNELILVLKNYCQLPRQERKKARRYLDDSINTGLKPFLSRSNYLKFKLRLI